MAVTFASLVLCLVFGGWQREPKTPQSSPLHSLHSSFSFSLSVSLQCKLLTLSKGMAYTLKPAHGDGAADGSYLSEVLCM